MVFESIEKTGGTEAAQRAVDEITQEKRALRAEEKFTDSAVETSNPN